MIGIIALLVIGPERLPGVAQTAGRWVGRGRRMIMDVKADIDKEIKADELKKILESHKVNNPLKDIVDETRDGAEQIRKQTEVELSQTEERENPPK